MHHPAAAVPPAAGLVAAQAAAAVQGAAGAQHAAAAGGGAGGAGDGDAGFGGAGAGQGAVGAIVPAQPPLPAAAAMQLARILPAPRRDTTNEYAALFVALIGEGPNPQGVVNTNEGKVVRAFHRFTLVDQTGQGRDLTKGRTREAGAVKISCARQDPNARNCHGYRKFVKVGLVLLTCMIFEPLHSSCCSTQVVVLLYFLSPPLSLSLYLWSLVVLRDAQG